MNAKQLRVLRFALSLCLPISIGGELRLPKCEAVEPSRSQSLLKDTAFAEGFGASFIYGRN